MAMTPGYVTTSPKPSLPKDVSVENLKRMLCLGKLVFLSNALFLSI
ncbi:Uncharacterised protein [Legionella oakridgensis]|nr:Uncharacterised protein [Legionella oakridgensis]